MPREKVEGEKQHLGGLVALGRGKEVDFYTLLFSTLRRLNVANNHLPFLFPEEAM